MLYLISLFQRLDYYLLDYCLALCKQKSVIKIIKINGSLFPPIQIQILNGGVFHQTEVKNTSHFQQTSFAQLVRLSCHFDFSKKVLTVYV